MQNKSSANSDRMQEVPSDSKEAAKMATKAATSFRENGAFSPQAVLSNSFSKVTIGGERNNINGSGSPLPSASAFNVGYNFTTDGRPIPRIVNGEGARKPYKKFAVVKSPGSPKSPTTTGSSATNAFGRAMGSSPSRNSPSSEKEMEKMVNVEKDVKAGDKVNKTELSKIVAKKLAKKAQEKNITKIYFDRGVYKYHGRVKIFAETLRKGGLEF